VPRKLRIQYPGAIYHVMNRGDQREDVFRGDADREKFLATLGEACGKTQVAGARVLPDAQPLPPGGGDSEAGRQQFAKLMESRRAQEAAADYEAVRRDWIIGSEEFRQELLRAASEGIGPTHYGGQRRETQMAKAERILRSEFERLGWKETGLGLLPKAHPVKVQLARQLRHETTLSLKWIASRLRMGSWTYLSNLLTAPAKKPTPGQKTLPFF